MRRTRILAVMLALLLTLSYGMFGMNSSVNAASAGGQRYYYNQLSNVAKGFYDAMYEMYVQGIFQTGSEAYDLIENGHVTSAQLAEYDGNQNGLLNQFGAARDAFYADYPDIFYVDFSMLSITVSQGSAPSEEETESETQNEAAVYQLSMGIGRSDTYYVEGFTSQEQVEHAIQDQQDRVNGIVQGAKAHSSSVREQVAYVYDAIIDHTEYRLETDCEPDNKGHIRTSYGALVKGQSLCEGYARAVKTVLDDMGINSVLVQGSFRAPDGSNNLHMWNYVQIDGKWYGLDATAGDGMKGSVDEGKYLLADQSVMNTAHTPNGAMSDCGVRFTYPQLAGADEGDKEQDPDTGNTDQDGYKSLFDKEGFLVAYRDGTDDEGEVGIFKVSYKGMGYQAAVDNEGVYMLERHYQYLPGLGEYRVGDWGYVDPKPFAIPQLEDALIFSNANSKYIEFAITKKPPVGPLYGDDILTAEELKWNWTFHGTEADFIVSTGKLENPHGNYVPSPYAVKITPSTTGYLSCGKKYHVTAVFNETLVPIDGQSVGYKIEIRDGWSAEQYSKVENFKWDNDRTVEFDFTPSDQLADNYTGYSFQITGLQGEESLKAPDSFSFDAKRLISVCTYRSQGILWNLGAKPQLLEPDDIFCGDWVNDKNERLKDVTNIVLTASKPEIKVETPDAGQSEQMLDLVEGKLPEGCTVRQSATYNIRLMTCNQNIVKTGQSVRLHIGFPEGFCADDVKKGVTYKAYHFIKTNNQITGVEELDCIVTDKGLIVTCYAFSPFAVVALDGDEQTATTGQKLLVMNNGGGEVRLQGAENARICELSEKGKTQTVEISAKDGYVINGLYLNGESRTVSDSKSMRLTIRYEDLIGVGNILDVVFAQDKSSQESVPPAQDKPNQEDAPPTQDKPSSGTQESNAPSQNASTGSSESTSSSNTAADNVGSSAGSSNNSNESKPAPDTTAASNTGSSAASPNGNGQNTAANNVPVVVLPQGTDQTIAQAQATTKAATAVLPSASAPATLVSDVQVMGESSADAVSGVISNGPGSDTAYAIVPDVRNEQERIVLSTGENGMELVVLPAEDTDFGGEEAGLSIGLLTGLICVVIVAMIVVAAVGFVKMRRDGYDD